MSLAESVKRMLENTGPGLVVQLLRFHAPRAGTWLRSLAWESRSSMRSAANDSNSNSKSTEAQLVNALWHPHLGELLHPTGEGLIPQQDLLEMRLQRRHHVFEPHPRLRDGPHRARGRGFTALSMEGATAKGEGVICGPGLPLPHWGGSQETSRPNRVGRALPCP